jgi:hypothetical protein
MAAAAGAGAGVGSSSPLSLPDDDGDDDVQDGDGDGRPFSVFLSRRLPRDAQQTLRATIPYVVNRPNASEKKNQRANLCFPEITRITSHPVPVKEPLLLHTHEIASLDIDLGDLAVHSTRQPQHVIGYVPLAADKRVEYTRALCDVSNVVAGYRNMTAARVLVAGTNRLDDAACKRIADDVLDAMRLHLMVAYSATAGRMLVRGPEAPVNMPDTLLWHTETHERFHESVAQAQRTMARVQRSEDDAAAAAAVGVSVANTPLVPRTIDQLAVRIAQLAQSMSLTAVERRQEIETTCVRYMSTKFPSHSPVFTDIGPLGLYLREYMTVLTFILWYENPFLCAYYPSHVGIRKRKATPRKSEGKVEELKARERHVDLSNKDAIEWLLRAAIHTVNSKTDDAQKNVHGWLTRHGATIHRYSQRTLQPLRAKLASDYVCVPRWAPFGYDIGTRAHQFELPPRFEQLRTGTGLKRKREAPLPAPAAAAATDSAVAASKPPPRKQAPLLPVFYSFVHVGGMLEYLVRRHTDVLDDDPQQSVRLLWQIRARTGTIQEYRLATEEDRMSRQEDELSRRSGTGVSRVLETHDATGVPMQTLLDHNVPRKVSAASVAAASQYVGTYVDCKLPTDMQSVTPALSASIRVTHILEAAWLAHLAWSYHRPPACAAAMAKAAYTKEFYLRRNFTGDAPAIDVTTLFGGMLYHDFCARWTLGHGAGPNRGAWRLAEMFMGCPSPGHAYPACDVGVWRALARQLRPSFVQWLYVSQPALPGFLYGAVMRHDSCATDAKAVISRARNSPQDLLHRVSQLQQTLRMHSSATAAVKARSEGARALFLRHFVALGLLNSATALWEPAGHDWSRALRAIFRQQVAPEPALVIPLVPPASNMPMILFKPFDAECDVRFMPPQHRPPPPDDLLVAFSKVPTLILRPAAVQISSRRRDPYAGASTSDQKEPRYWGVRLPETTDGGSDRYFRFRRHNGQLAVWAHRPNDPPPTLLEQTLYARHMAFPTKLPLCGHLNNLFESLLLLLAVLHDETRCHEVLQHVFVQHSPGNRRAQDYEHMLHASRLIFMNATYHKLQSGTHRVMCDHLLRLPPEALQASLLHARTNAQLTADERYLVCVLSLCRHEQLSTVKLEPQFHQRVVDAALKASIETLRAEANTSLEHYGVAGALQLANELALPLEPRVLRHIRAFATVADSADLLRAVSRL